MMGLCMYELVYSLSILLVLIIFPSLAIFNLYRRKFSFARNMLSLGMTSLLIVGLGIIAAEVCLEYLFTYRGCEKAEGIASFSMLFSMIGIVALSIKVKDRDYVISKKTDKILLKIFLFLVACFCLVLILDLFDLL
jgi:hypothetical protein